MLTPSQKSDLLFKKLMGKGSSNHGDYYNELLNGRVSVQPNQIWAQSADIPIPSSPANSGVVTYFASLTLLPVPGESSSFYHPSLVDAIPFNFDPSGSYVPTLRKNDSTIIPFGQNDWILDGDVGQVTFYNGIPSGVSAALPPKVTFWKYVGQKGIVSSGTQVIDYISGQVESPSVDNYYYLINNAPTEMNLQSLNIALWNGSGQASILVDSTPVPGLTNIPLTGTDTLYSADAGGYLAPSGSTIILSMSGMSVNAGRTRFTLTIKRSLG